MSKKSKISIRKVLQALVTLIVTAACITAMISASKIENEKRITGINVAIKNGDKYHFIDKESILKMVISDRHIDLAKLPVSKVDLQSMEKIITADPWVASAEVFVDNTHALHINVVQRIPVARIFETTGASYYLDTALNSMPLSGSYMYYTTIITNVPELKNDSTGRSLKGQMVSLVRCIERDTFWNAQISQIIMDSAYSFELVPVLGNQHILIGDTSRMQEKFDNLFMFYKKVLNNIGWDKYEVLDLRFKGQVIASPTLPWKAPVDKGMNTDWIKDINETTEKGNANTNDTSKKVAAPQVLPAKQAIVPQTPKTPIPAKQIKTTKAAALPAKKIAEKKKDIPKKKQPVKEAAHSQKAAKEPVSAGKHINNNKTTLSAQPVKKAKGSPDINHEKNNNTQSGKYIYRGQ